MYDVICKTIIDTINNKVLSR